MENSSICLVKNVHHSTLMDRNVEMLVTVPKDTNIAPVYSDAALRSVAILKTFWGGTSSIDHARIDKEDQTYVDDGHADKEFTPFVSNKQKKKNKSQQSKGLKDDCIHTRAKSGISKAYKKN